MVLSKAVRAAVTLTLTVAMTALMAPAAVTAADEGVSLPLQQFGSLLVDDAHQRLYLSAGFGDDEVLVTDFTGQVVKQITGQSGALGMALSPDATRLYVALADGHEISEIDTASLTETRRFALGSEVCPRYLAVQGTRMWFTYQGCPFGGQSLGSIELSASPPAVRTDHITNGTSTLISQAGSRLALGADGGTALSTFAIEAGEVRQLASTRTDGELVQLQAGQGGQVLTAGPGGPGDRGIQIRNADDLSSLGEYTTADRSAQAMAVSRDESLIAAGTRFNDPDVWVFRSGDDTPLRTIEFGRDSSNNELSVAWRGLGLSADGGRLFAVTDTGQGRELSLHVVDQPFKQESLISVDVPEQAERGEPITVTGRFSVQHRTVTEPVTLQVRRVDRDGTDALPDIDTAADGTFSFTETPPEGGPSTYTVSYAGDEERAPATGSGRLLVPTVDWDVNGDDIADVLVGTPGEDVGTAPNAGGFTLLNGAGSGVSASGARAWTQNTVGIPGASEQGDRLGSASTSGDFNADGFADVAVGAPGEDFGTTADTGLVQVLYGSRTGLTTVDNDVFDAADYEPAGPAISLGASLASGDFEGDGYEDLAIGAPTYGLRSGRVFLFRGGAEGLGRAYRDWIGQTDGPSANVAGEQFGYALAVGDGNGDGQDDLAVGVPWNRQGGSNPPTGTVLVYYSEQTTGISGGVVREWNKDSVGVPGDSALFGSDLPDSFGQRLAFADYNGDSYADLAVAAPGAPESTPTGTVQDAGSVNIFHGSFNGLTPGELVTQQTAGVPGLAETNDRFGAALAGNDTDADGDAELAITAIGDRNVTVLDGSNGTLGSAPDAQWSQQTPGVPGATEAEDRFGDTLRFAPYNSTGPSSLAVGVPGENTSRGAVVLVYSDGAGLTAAGARAFSQDTTGVPGVSEAGDAFGNLF